MAAFRQERQYRQERQQMYIDIAVELSKPDSCFETMQQAVALLSQRGLHLKAAK